jgi:hypothetical protein
VARSSRQPSQAVPSGSLVEVVDDSATDEDNGDSWLIVTTVVEDPRYLNGRFFTSSHFKKLPDASGWKPAPCSAR